MTKKPHFNPPREEGRLKKFNWQRLLLILMLVGIFGPLKAQSGNEEITLNLKNAKMAAFVKEIKAQAGYTFFYNDSTAKAIEPITINVRKATLKSVLEEVVAKKGFTYIIEDKTVVIKKKTTTVAQVDLIEVTGKVTDEDGNPIPGATVLVHGTTQGVASDVDGRYTLRMKSDDVLKVSFVGYETAIIPVQGKKRVNVVLKSTTKDLEEVSVVAFGTQKKESVVSAITTVRPMDLKSSNSDLTSSFAGKIAGVIGWQTGGYPGSLDRGGNEH